MKRSIYLAAALFGGLLVSCDSVVDAGCGYDFEGKSSAGYADASVNQLLDSARRFNAAANRIEEDVHAVCRSILSDMGKQVPSGDVETVCKATAEQINAVFEAHPDIKIGIQAQEPICSIDARAQLDCVADCELDESIKTTPIECDAGKLSGDCSGTCTGSCTLSGSAQCDAQCTGTCSGTCDADISGQCAGTCGGTCEGECDGQCTDSDGDDSVCTGSCAGTCKGICRGSCTGNINAQCYGKCDGSCQGECTSDVMADCKGRCTGSCDVDFIAPRCEGGDVKVDASVECKAACQTDARVDIQCSEPSAQIGIDGDELSDLSATIVALETHLPRLLSLGETAEELKLAGAAYIDSLDNAAGALSAGVEEGFCIAQSVGVQAAVVSRVEITLTASVEVSHSAGFSAN